MGFEKAEKSRQFFDLKIRAGILLDQIEKTIFENSKTLDELDWVFREMRRIAEVEKSPYFSLRSKSLSAQVSKFRKRKGYRKIEFDRFYSTLEKIQETDAVEFLNRSLQKKIEKISESYLGLEPSQSGERAYLPLPNTFFILNFQKTHFIFRHYPYRILQNIPFSKKYLQQKDLRFPIFPLVPFVSRGTLQSHSSKLMLIRTQTAWRGIRFDFLDAELEIPEDEFEARKRPLGKSFLGVDFFLKWRGNATPT